MAWIESHTVLLRHPKLLRLARELRLKPVHCLGHLHALWHATLETREDGDLSSWSDEDIAAAAGVTSDAPTFVSSLRLSGWLDNALVHDWLDYAGLYLTRKYAKRNKERLAEIWGKHGRVYGSGERPSDNLATSKQLSLVKPVGRCIVSKDSSKLEGREFYNPGLHTDIAGQAVRLVALYLTCVKTSHRSAAKPATTALGQIFVDEPTLEITSIERGISAYAAECDAQDAPPKVRLSPLKFFAERRWESYIGLPPPKPRTQTATSAEEIAKLTS